MIKASLSGDFPTTVNSRRQVASSCDGSNNDALNFDGKYLGLWKPASSFKCCCGILWTLENAVKYFAVIQIIIGVGTFLSYLITRNPNQLTSWSSPLVDIGLASWVVHGLKTKQLPPILNFTFAQFILGVTATINMIVLMIYYFASASVTEDKSTRSSDIGLGFLYLFTNLYSAVYKYYYSYITWSCAQAMKKQSSEYVHSPVLVEALVSQSEEDGYDGDMSSINKIEVV
mmetsp:Transcript_12105/g.14638  ORF Transcript_12105/g.14638 Transcript_12105/m.14638 type:complete len:230 (+) Transcript_12105:127-816(+)